MPLFLIGQMYSYLLQENVLHKNNISETEFTQYVPL